MQITVVHSKLTIKLFVMYTCIFILALLLIGLIQSHLYKGNVLVYGIIFTYNNILQVFLGSIVQVLLCIASSFILLKFHKDMGKFEFILCSSAFGFNALLFTIDAIIMCQQILFKRPANLG